MDSFEALIERWDGEEVVVALEAASSAWIFICIHSTVLGPAGGGTRLKVYPTPADGLADAMRLAAGMTAKMAVAGLAFGGAKAVLAVREIPTGEARGRLLHRYADAIETLNGTFLTGPDMNTSSADMDTISERSTHVFSRSADHGGSGNP